MAEKRYVDFLNKLINSTKERKIDWKYLDTNQELYEGMEWIKTSTEFALWGGSKEKTVLDFNKEDSFYAQEDGTYIVIYVWGNRPAKLYVVPSTFKKVVIFTPDEYGEYITRLLNLVQNQFPNGESFIDVFLNDNT